MHLYFRVPQSLHKLPLSTTAASWLRRSARLHFGNIIDLYYYQATCVCFLGEGGCSPSERRELASYAALAHEKGLSVCLYSGRDTVIEDWMDIFDFIKLGSYNETLGPLDSPTTNQRFFRKTACGRYEDITFLFWPEGKI